MRNYRVVYRSMTASYDLGEYQAESEDSALRQAKAKCGDTFSPGEWAFCIHVFPVQAVPSYELWAD